MRGPIHRFLKGRSRIRLTGSGVIRCLNLLLGKGVALKDVYRENGTILAWMSTKDVEQAEIYAKKSGCTVEILREKGFPAWKKQYGNRYGFVIGLILLVLGVFVWNSFIWGIDIQGNETLSDLEVRSRLAEYGLTEGTWKGGHDLEGIKNQMLLEYPEWSWMSLSIEGTTLQVRLTEGTKPPSIYEEGDPRDWVADRDGIIYSIVTTRGTPMVRAGDVVRKGDVLISGTLEIPMEDGTTQYQFTEAAGEVYALCTQEITLEQEAAYIEKAYTGEMVHELLLQWGDTQISLYKPFRNLEYADVIEEPLGSEFGNFLGEIPGIPSIYLIRRTYVLYEPIEKNYREDQMKVLLGAALQKERDRLLEEENGILTEETIDYQETQTGIKGTLSMKMMVEMGEAGALEPPPDTQEDES